MLIKCNIFTFYLININFVKVLNKIVADYAEPGSVLWRQESASFAAFEVGIAWGRG